MGHATGCGGYALWERTHLERGQPNGGLVFMIPWTGMSARLSQGGRVRLHDAVSIAGRIPWSLLVLSILCLFLAQPNG